MLPSGEALPERQMELVAKLPWHSASEVHPVEAGMVLGHWSSGDRTSCTISINPVEVPVLPPVGEPYTMLSNIIVVEFNVMELEAEDEDDVAIIEQFELLVFEF